MVGRSVDVRRARGLSVGGGREGGEEESQLTSSSLSPLKKYTAAALPSSAVSSSSDPAADAIYLLSWHIFAASSPSPSLGPNTKGKEGGMQGRRGDALKWSKRKSLKPAAAALDSATLELTYGVPATCTKVHVCPMHALPLPRAHLPARVRTTDGGRRKGGGKGPLSPGGVPLGPFPPPLFRYTKKASPFLSSAAAAADGHGRLDSALR